MFCILPVMYAVLSFGLVPLKFNSNTILSILVLLFSFGQTLLVFLLLVTFSVQICDYTGVNHDNVRSFECAWYRFCLCWGRC